MQEGLEVWDDLPLILNVAETARLMRCTMKHIKQELRGGRMPGRRVGLNMWRIPRDQLRSWLEGHGEGAWGREAAPPELSA